MATFHPVMVEQGGAARRARDEEDGGASAAPSLAALRRGLVLVPACMALVVVALVAASQPQQDAGARPSALLAGDARLMRSLSNLARELAPAASAGAPHISLDAHRVAPRAERHARAMNLAYTNHLGRFFKPSKSSSFSLIKLDNVDVTFLDKSNLKGYDAADMAVLGQYSVMTRMGMILKCNSANFNNVDGILGFGWADAPRSAALLKTLTQLDRPSWNLMNQPFEGDHKPMPRKFTFTASDDLGELQLGGYDPALVSSDFTMFHMTGLNSYGIPIHSITYGGVELLHFAPTNHKKMFAGELDSGTTCLLLPSTVVKGNFTQAPFSVLRAEQMKGKRHPLIYKAYDVHGVEHAYTMPYHECVEPADETMILGDPFFRKFAVLHDLVDLDNKMMGLAPKNPNYKLGVFTDTSILVPHSSRVHVTGSGLTRMHAKRRMRDAAFTQSLHQVRSALHAAHETELFPDCIFGGCNSPVDKVAIKSKTMVTYEVQLAIGTPKQPLDVIFDTGSYMLAVFAEPPPGKKESKSERARVRASEIESERARARERARTLRKR